MASAIWSTPPGQVADFPLEPFLRFFDNHGLLSPLHRPRWQTVVGGSCAYVNAFLERFSGEVRTEVPVVGLRRDPDAVVVRTKMAGEIFDRAVVATHADEALGLFEAPNEAAHEFGCRVTGITLSEE